jgi:D-alanine-D-alanine ligase
MKHKVAVLAGGLSLERDVSLRSGQRVADVLADRGYDVSRLDLDDSLVPTLAQGHFDVAFLTLHGKAGEDGTIQNLLELLDVRYTGPDAIASALAWDKSISKGLWSRDGLPTPDWIAVSSDAIRDMGAARALDRIVERLGTPLVVKPSQGGASMGVRIITEPSELASGLIASFSYHDVVLVEQFIAGAEIAISIVDGKALPAVEIAPKEGAYDFAARYTAGSTEFFAPARLDQAVLDEASRVALRAYEIAGCRHVTRADMIVAADGRPHLLELDTCPGMTETSLLPIAAQAEGWDFGELCERLVQLATT